MDHETKKRAAISFIEALELIQSGEWGRRVDEHLKVVMDALGVVQVADYEDGTPQYDLVEQAPPPTATGKE